MAKIQELAAFLSKKHKIQQQEAERFLSLLVDVLNSGLRDEKLVKIKGLGTFKVIEVKDRESVNVNTGERIVIEGRPKITFTPDAVMKDLVNKPFAQFETVALNEGVTFEDIPDEVQQDEEPETAVDEVAQAKVAALVEEAAQVAEAVQQEVAAPQEEVALVEKAAPVEQSVAESPENLENLESLESLETLDSVESPKAPEIPAPSTAPIRSEEPAHTTLNKISNETVENDDFVPVIGDNAKIESPAPKAPAATVEVEKPAAAVEAPQKKNGSKSWIGWLLGMIAVGAIMYFVGYHFGKENSTAAVSEPVKKEVSAPTTVVVDTAAQKAADSEKTAQLAAEQAAAEQAAAEKAAAEKAAAEKAAAEKAKADSIAKAEAYAKAEAAKKAAYEAELKKQQAQQQSTSAPQTGDNQRALNNARGIVNTGAYTIVGTDQVVTVRKGQTLEKISKAYFGPGMEAYVIVHNGVTQVSEGMKLKIPKLKVKSKKK